MASIKTLLITQARVGSTRLPGKVLLKINDDELLKIHAKRLQQCKLIDVITVATTTNESNDVIVSLCNEWGLKTSRGSEDDVLDRFYQAAKIYNPEWVVRVTSDCPLIDPKLIDAVIAFAQVNDVDYCSNTLIENFPDGQDVEVFKFSALAAAWEKAKLKSEREHVTPYIRTHADFNKGTQFKAMNFPCRDNFSDVRMTVDEPSDFELIRRVILDLGKEESWLTYTRYIISNDLNQINANIVRNEGMLKSLKND